MGALPIYCCAIPSSTVRMFAAPGFNNNVVGELAGPRRDGQATAGGWCRSLRQRCRTDAGSSNTFRARDGRWLHAWRRQSRASTVRCCTAGRVPQENPGKRSRDSESAWKVVDLEPSVEAICANRRSKMMLQGFVCALHRPLRIGVRAVATSERKSIEEHMAAVRAGLEKTTLLASSRSRSLPAPQRH